MTKIRLSHTDKAAGILELVHFPPKHALLDAASVWNLVRDRASILRLLWPLSTGQPRV